MGGQLIKWVAIAALVAASTASGTNAAKSASTGRSAPEFSVSLLNGTQKRLADYKGKVLVLNYWATWCAPCKAEMPMMSRFHQRNKARGFEIIGIVTRDPVLPYQLKRVAAALSYPLAMNLTGKYGIIRNAVPTNYIIDRKGIVRYAKAQTFTEDDFKKLIEPLLAE